MTIKSLVIAIMLFCTVTGCEEVENQKTDPSLQTDVSNQTKPLRQPIQNNNTSETELSCLQQCGQEARGTIYADCLAAGGEQQECATNGRQWYRNCLQTQCDEAAIKLDDCRTECRMNSKEDYHQCVTESNDTEACRSKRKTEVQECIAECE